MMQLVDYILTSSISSSVFINASITLMSLYIPMYILLRGIFKQRYYWEVFTRIISMLNAIQCIWIICKFVLPEYNHYFDLEYIGNPNLIRGLYWFAAYLAVDGLFYLPDFIYRPTIQMFTTVAHHFVGGFGIYLIARESRGLGLGVYFAWTEISTPLLHISWILYTNKIVNWWSKSFFIAFYLVFVLARIATIPLILSWIYTNNKLVLLEPLIQRCMVYGGSGTLIGLNFIWFVMLTIKAGKILCSNKNNKV